jgi:O-antigen/teichoic acid export membrane protein
LHIQNYLPLFIRQQIHNRLSLQKIIANTGWLVFERIVHLGIGFAISILVARYLGPQKFGILSYALSIIAFLGTFVYLGLSGLVVRDIVRYPDDKELILGTTFSLKFSGSVFAFLVVLCFAFFMHEEEGYEFCVIVIIGLSLFARPFETIDFWFQSQVQSKYAVMAKFTAFVVAALLKTLLIFFGASLVSIAAAFCLETILVSTFLVAIYRYRGFSIFHWKTQLSKAKELFCQSWIIIVSGFLAMVNLKVDQIMLRWISGPREVGIYSVAVTFSEVWYFIPTVIAMSVYPRLIELEKLKSVDYNKKMQQVFDVLFGISFFVALLMSFAAGPLIPLLYTDAYAGSSAILIIHVWAGIFMFMRALFSKWVLIEEALFFSLITHGFGAIANVSLNYFLIPHYGGKGAAFATLLSYSVSSYFVLFLYSKTRPLAYQMSKSLILPFRLILYRNKTWA